MDIKRKKVDGLGERIRECREKLRLSRSQVANDLNIAMSTLQAWEANDREPPASDIVALAKLLDTDTNYLLHGQYQDSTVNPRYHQTDDEKGTIINDYREIKVSAGFGANNSQITAIPTTNIEKSWLQAKSLKAEDCGMFRVSGDSMEPTLRDGEDVIVNLTKKELSEGKIFVINNAGTIWVKKIQRTLDKVRLISDNPAYPPIELDKTEAENLIIIGQVVRGYRDF